MKELLMKELNQEGLLYKGFTDALPSFGCGKSGSRFLSEPKYNWLFKKCLLEKKFI